MNEKKDCEGDDSMSAVATNHVYRVLVRGKEKQIPTVGKEKIDMFKNSLSKYFQKK